MCSHYRETHDYWLQYYGLKAIILENTHKHKGPPLLSGYNRLQTKNLRKKRYRKGPSLVSGYNRLQNSVFTLSLNTRLLVTILLVKK